jgi:hypothetical protein
MRSSTRTEANDEIRHGIASGQHHDQRNDAADQHEATDTFTWATRAATNALSFDVSR